MKVVFVCPTYESIGIECLSAYLKKNGHTTSLVFDPLLFDNAYMQIRPLARIFDYRKAVLAEIIGANPDVVALPVTGFDLPWAFAIASAVKKYLNVPVVLGGAHAWICPEQLIQNEAVDYVVQGEGEEALTAIAKKIEEGEDSTTIPNTWYRDGEEIVQGQFHPPSHDLDDLPIPDKDLFYSKLKHLYGYSVVARRFCNNSCAYCHNNAVKRAFYPQWKLKRGRSAENTIEELQWARTRYPMESVWFFDDNFCIDPNWLSRFADLYANLICIPYRAMANPDSLTPRSIRDLSRSGCYEVQIGVQTINPQIKKELGRTESVEQVLEAVDGLKKSGIRSCVDFILGLPGECEQDALHAGMLFNLHRPARIVAYWLDYVPKADIGKIAFEKGVLNERDLVVVNGSMWMSSMLRGDRTLAANRGIHRLQMLLTVLPLVSRNTFDLIVRKRLYRFFPVRVVPHLLGALAASFTRHERDMNWIRFKRLHLEFIPKILWFSSVRLFGKSERTSTMT